MNVSNHTEWEIAIEDIQSLHKNCTWDLFQLPKGKSAIEKKEGSLETGGDRYQARFVAKGCAQ